MAPPIQPAATADEFNALYMERLVVDVAGRPGAPPLPLGARSRTTMACPFCAAPGFVTWIQYHGQDAFAGLFKLLKECARRCSTCGRAVRTATDEHGTYLVQVDGPPPPPWAPLRWAGDGPAPVG